jgi:hypothetical protein
MAANAERGLTLREKHGRGGTEVGVARARDIKNRKNLSPDTVRRMHSYFARHEVDKKGEGWGNDSAGYIAWLLWGGDAGKAWADRKSKELDRKEDKTVNSKASHSVKDDGEKIKIERVELFMAFDPAIDDGDSDPELKRFNNERLKSIVRATRAHMARGSFPQVVVMHEKNGDEPKSAVGRIPSINYEERNGIGYIVGDMEVNKPIFDSLIATHSRVGRQRFGLNRTTCRKWPCWAARPRAGRCPIPTSPARGRRSLVPSQTSTSPGSEADSTPLSRRPPRRKPQWHPTITAKSLRR